MATTLDPDERKVLLPKLWQAFIDKIDLEWGDKYASFGESRQAVEYNTKLAQAIRQDMLDEAERRNAPAVAITWNLIHQNLDRDGFSSGAKANTLYIFLRYCGYDGWPEFKAGTREVRKKRGTKTAKEKVDKPDNFFRNPWTYLGPMFLLAVATIALSMWWQDDESERANMLNEDAVDAVDVEEELKEFLKSAGQFDLELRKKTPSLADTSALHRYYTPDSPARARLLASLNRAIEQNRRVDPMAGACDVISVKIIREDDDFWELETREHWYLRWENINTLRDTLLYDETNVQQYFIAKTPDGPRIHINRYEGEVEVL